MTQQTLAIYISLFHRSFFRWICDLSGLYPLNWDEGFFVCLVNIVMWATGCFNVQLNLYLVSTEKAKWCHSCTLYFLQQQNQCLEDAERNLTKWNSKVMGHNGMARMGWKVGWQGAGSYESRPGSILFQNNELNNIMAVKYFIIMQSCNTCATCTHYTN